jgi:hypothetical protein
MLLNSPLFLTMSRSLSKTNSDMTYINSLSVKTFAILAIRCCAKSMFGLARWIKDTAEIILGCKCSGKFLKCLGIINFPLSTCRSILRLTIINFFCCLDINILFIRVAKFLMDTFKTFIIKCSFPFNHATMFGCVIFDVEDSSI